MKYLDANILNRFILNDIPEQADYAEKIISNGDAFVLPEVFAEVVYVLTNLLAAYDFLEQKEICTFDKNLKKFIDRQRED